MTYAVIWARLLRNCLVCWKYANHVKGQSWKDVKSKMTEFKRCHVFITYIIIYEDCYNNCCYNNAWLWKSEGTGFLWRCTISIWMTKGNHYASVAIVTHLLLYLDACDCHQLQPRAHRATSTTDFNVAFVLQQHVLSMCQWQRHILYFYIASWTCYRTSLYTVRDTINIYVAFAIVSVSIFRQICQMLPIAMGRSVSVSMCVCLSNCLLQSFT